MDIQAKGILITGGCGGIGLGIAEYFAERGKVVWLVDRDISAAAPLQARYPAIKTVQLDISNHAEVDRVLGEIFSRSDAPELVVNGAGKSPKYDADGKPWRTWTMPLSHWQDVMAVNLDAAFNVARLALPKMIERRYGRIINIASLATRTGGGVAPVHYVTSKSALLGLTKSIAKEVGEFGITVNAINPGRIDTPMIRDVSDEVNRGFAARVPLGRLGTPKDLAGTVAFLCSTEGEYLTGTCIEVNGGLYMGP